MYLPLDGYVPSTLYVCSHCTCLHLLLGAYLVLCSVSLYTRGVLLSIYKRLYQAAAHLSYQVLLLLLCLY
jgi:hypothetical protein